MPLLDHDPNFFLLGLSDNCHTLKGALLQYPQMPASLTLVTDQSSHVFTRLIFPKDWFCQPLIVFAALPEAGEVCGWEGCLMYFHSSFQKAITFPAFGFLPQSFFFCKGFPSLLECMWALLFAYSFRSSSFFQIGHFSPFPPFLTQINAAHPAMWIKWTHLELMLYDSGLSLESMNAWLSTFQSWLYFGIFWEV